MKIFKGIKEKKKIILIVAVSFFIFIAAVVAGILISNSKKIKEATDLALNGDWQQACDLVEKIENDESHAIKKYCELRMECASLFGGTYQVNGITVRPTVSADIVDHLSWYINSIQRSADTYDGRIYNKTCEIEKLIRNYDYSAYNEFCKEVDEATELMEYFNKDYFDALKSGKPFVISEEQPKAIECFESLNNACEIYNKATEKNLKEDSEYIESCYSFCEQLTAFFEVASKEHSTDEQLTISSVGFEFHTLTLSRIICDYYLYTEVNTGNFDVDDYKNTVLCYSLFKAINEI